MNGDGSALNDWTSAIGSLGGTAGGILGALNKPKTTVAPKAPATNLGMIAAIVVGGLLLVVVLFAVMGRK
jgi:hypothetical protein